MILTICAYTEQMPLHPILHSSAREVYLIEQNGAMAQHGLCAQLLEDFASALHKLSA